MVWGCLVLPVALGPAAPAWAQTGGLEAPSVWLLVASLAQIVGAAALVVFFITRRRPRRCARCGRILGRGVTECPRCGGAPGGPGPERARS